jgi:hypothetical protein
VVVGSVSNERTTVTYSSKRSIRSVIVPSSMP